MVRMNACRFILTSTMFDVSSAPTAPVRGTRSDESGSPLIHAKMNRTLGLKNEETQRLRTTPMPRNIAAQNMHQIAPSGGWLAIHADEGPSRTYVDSM